MTTDFNVISFEMGKLELKPGDKIVLKTELTLSADQVMNLREKLRPFVPGHEIIVLTSGLTMEVLRPIPFSDEEMAMWKAKWSEQQL